ncbi:MAG: two-component regulator propeller domain-containing protein, partial [Ferruginibacter sp.]
MKYACSKILLICLCLFPLKGSGQKPAQVKFDRITTDDGLSQGMVNSILQDRYGFMWFASNDGLNRYDGNNFTVYKNDPNDNNSIADNFIRYLFEDSAGRVWIATAGNGLDLFDRTTETFVHFKYSAENTNSISDNSITSIDEDKLGGIWVGTLHGLNRLLIKDRKDIKKTVERAGDATESFLLEHTVSFTKIIFDTADPKRELYARDPTFPLADWRASNFHVDQQGFIWVSAQKRLFRIKPLVDARYQLENLPVEAYMPLL